MDPVRRSFSASLLALGAVALWSLLAALAVQLRAVPPFLLLGLALTGAGLLAAPTWRRWRVPLRTLLVGVYGIFGFHLLLFLALRRAPPVEANLVNYLWPLLIVLLAPAFDRRIRLGARHLLAGLLGFAGAAWVITGGRFTFSAAHWDGYALALGSALVWSTYSLALQRLPRFSSAAVGLFCLVSGLLALACHLVVEPRYWPEADQWIWIGLLAAGPMGAAFFLWDAAFKRGDARSLGALAYLTPLGSTLALLATGHGQLTAAVAAGGALIVAGAVMGAAQRRGR